MGITLSRPITVERFLAWEERQELRHEFDGERPIAMNGGTFAHEIIGQTVRALLRERLRGRAGHVLGPSMKIDVRGHIRYPDAFVSFATPSPNVTVMPAPIVVFEVVSPGSSRTDRILKLRDYRASDTIEQYVILEQDSVAALVFTRTETAWETRSLIRGDTLDLPAIGVSLPLADLYVDLDLPERDDAQP